MVKAFIRRNCSQILRKAGYTSRLLLLVMAHTYDCCLTLPAPTLRAMSSCKERVPTCSACIHVHGVLHKLQQLSKRCHVLQHVSSPVCSPGSSPADLASVEHGSLTDESRPRSTEDVAVLYQDQMRAGRRTGSDYTQPINGGKFLLQCTFNCSCREILFLYPNIPNHHNICLVDDHVQRHAPP